MTRRPATPSFARKKRICASRGWTTPDGDMIALEAGKVVTLKNGVPLRFDHIHQFCKSRDDSDENYQPLTPESDKVKTAADSKARAKLRRLTGQNKTRIKKKIRSRPLTDPRFRKTFAGKVVPR